jgi:hypothetical protein
MLVLERAKRGHLCNLRLTPKSLVPPYQEVVGATQPRSLPNWLPSWLPRGGWCHLTKSAILIFAPTAITPFFHLIILPQTPRLTPIAY